MPAEMLLRCATWNVHRAKGTDGLKVPARVESALADVVAPLSPHILALQEADEECRPHARILNVEKIEQATGLRSVHTRPELRWGPESDGFLGVILFLSPRFEAVHGDVIDLPGHCHRGAIAVEARCRGCTFRVMSAHLSLTQPLRLIQMRILGQYIRRRPPMQTIFLGDMNEWRPWGGLMFHRKVVGTDFRGPTCATFPSKRPVLHLDRILTDQSGAVRSVAALKTPETQLASDHLPLFAEVTAL